MLLESTSKGVVLNVRVITRAGRSGLAGTRDNALLIRLNAPPVDGAANAALIAFLADLLDRPKRDIAIVSGQLSRDKRITVSGMTAAQLAETLSDILPA